MEEAHCDDRFYFMCCVVSKFVCYVIGLTALQEFRSQPQWREAHCDKPISSHALRLCPLFVCFEGLLVMCVCPVVVGVSRSGNKHTVANPFNFMIVFVFHASCSCLGWPDQIRPMTPGMF